MHKTHKQPEIPPACLCQSQRDCSARLMGSIRGDKEAAKQ